MTGNKSYLSDHNNESPRYMKTVLESSDYITVELTAHFKNITNLPHLWPGTKVVMEWTDGSRCVKGYLKRHLNTSTFTPIVLEWKVKLGKRGSFNFKNEKENQGSFKIRVKKMSDPRYRLHGEYKINPGILLQSYFKTMKSTNTETVEFGNHISGTLCTCIEVRGKSQVEEDKDGGEGYSERKTGDGDEQVSSERPRLNARNSDHSQLSQNRIKGQKEDVQGLGKRANSLDYTVLRGTVSVEGNKEKNTLQSSMSENTINIYTNSKDEAGSPETSKRKADRLSEDRQCKRGRVSLIEKALDNEIIENMKNIEILKREVFRSLENCKVDLEKDCAEKNSFPDSQKLCTRNTKYMRHQDAIQLHYQVHRPDVCRAEELKKAEFDIADAVVQLLQKVWNRDVKKVEDIHISLPLYLNDAERACLKQPTQNLEMAIAKFFRALHISTTTAQISAETKEGYCRHSPRDKHEAMQARNDAIVFEQLLVVIKSLRLQIDVAEKERREGQKTEGAERSVTADRRRNAIKSFVRGIELDIDSD